MSFNLQRNGALLANIEVAGINGQPGLGHYRLLMHLKLSMPGAPEGEKILLMDLGGSLSVSRGGGSFPLGVLYPSGKPTVTEALKDWRFPQETLAVELDYRKLEAIEDVRLGGDLTLMVSLWARVVRNSEFEFVSDTVTHHVNKGVWVETLGQLGYAKRMLLEVPVPDPNDAPQLAETAGHLSKAHQAMTRGDWRETVGCCRDVLESLSVALGEGKYTDPDMASIFENSRNKNKDERLRAIRQALMVFTHPARHADEVSAAIEWDRTDAVVMVSTLSALLKRFIEPKR